MPRKDIYHAYPADISRLWSRSMSQFWQEAKTGWYEEVIERVLVYGGLLRKHDIQPRGALYLGANVGQLLWVWLLLGYRKVLLVEPQPSALPRLEWFTNVSSNLLFAYDRFVGLEPPAEIQVVKCAAGAEDGETKLYVVSNSNLTSILKPHEPALREQARNAGVADPTKIGVVQEITVPMMKLDTLLDEPTTGLRAADYNFLYMNLQGAEYQALRGARRSLEHVELVYLENDLQGRYEHSATEDELDALLGECGFEAVWGQIHEATGVGFTAYVRKRAP